MVSFSEDFDFRELPSLGVRPRRDRALALGIAAPVCSDHVRDRRSGYVNGVRLDPVSRTELGERIAEFLNCGSSHVVHFCAAHPTVVARQNQAYRDLLNRGDLNVPDGMPVAWALRLFGCAADRLAGADAMSFLCEWGVERNIRHYLFGSTPAVVARLQTTLEARVPGIHIVGAESPPFRPLTDEEWAGATARIRRAQADLLWVGLGAPKQDPVGQRLRLLDAAPAILCVGAAFDFLSGAQKRAPRWMRDNGLEWFHRCIHEPKRLSRRYVIGNSRFVSGVARDYLAVVLGDREGGSSPSTLRRDDATW
jgi:N-acetylglucosaminyldiphosphoundecaprenol N-acetyl-beta-D-mannosaminyltransferase